MSEERPQLNCAQLYKFRKLHDNARMQSYGELSQLQRCAGEARLRFHPEARSATCKMIRLILLRSSASLAEQASPGKTQVVSGGFLRAASFAAQGPVVSLPPMLRGKSYGDGPGATHAASGAALSAGTAAYRASRSTSRAARREAEHLQQSLSEFFERQPWATGALGLAVGAAAAASLPKTQTEQEWMEETSDATKDRARSLVSEETAREARAQGLSEEQVADAVRAFSEKLPNVAATAGDSLDTEVDKATGASTKP